MRGQVEQLSFDHKPGNEAETKRIISAGGWVEFNRVNGIYFHYFLLHNLTLDIKTSFKNIDRIEQHIPALYKSFLLT